MASPLQDLYRRPGFLLKRCHQVSMAIFLDECREFGVTQSQYGCLRALHEYPGVDQIALGRLVGLDRSTVGLVIKTLTERGLIERVVNSRDKRRLLLKNSAEGEKMLVAIGPAAARAQERVLSVLPRETRAGFLDLLENFLAGHDALIDAMEVVSAIPAPDLPQSARTRSASKERAAAARSARRSARA